MMKYRYLGITDERDACDCCGRTNLKRTVVLDIDGEVVYFGTTCAARALKVPAAEVRKGAKRAQDEKDAAARAERQAIAEAKSRQEREAFEAWCLARTGTRDGWEAAKALGVETFYAARLLWFSETE